jgi:endonuclease YncB( thermonuclease family)
MSNTHGQRFSPKEEIFQMTIRNLTSVAVILLLAACSGEIQSTAIAQEPARVGEYRVTVESVYDGDTFSIRLDGLPEELQPVKIRVLGVDSPERGSPRCDAERAGAERARRFTESTIQRAGDQVIITDLDWDKWGGRIDAHVLVGPRRESLTTLLIESGNARAYQGGAREGWC